MYIKKPNAAPECVLQEKAEQKNFTGQKWGMYFDKLKAKLKAWFSKQKEGLKDAPDVMTDGESFFEMPSWTREK